jgi:hypothetical protein
MATLKGWKHFCDLRRQGAELCDSKTGVNLNRFRARFKAAKRFRTVVMDGYSDNAMRGYSAGIRLLLCYTSAELLGETIGPGINQWTIHDPNITDALRAACRNLHEDQNAISSKLLRVKLSEFINAENDNLRIAATALRVMVAHGHFTPSGTKSMTKSNAEAIHCLGDHLLAQSEQRFTEWLREQTEKPGG